MNNKFQESGIQWNYCERIPSASKVVCGAIGINYSQMSLTYGIYDYSVIVNNAGATALKGDKGRGFDCAEW